MVLIFDSNSGVKPTAVFNYQRYVSFVLFGVQVQMSMRMPQLILDLHFRSLKIAVSIQGSTCSAS